MFCAIINYQFKTSELKSVEKLVKQKRLGMYIFARICHEIIVLVGGP